MDKVVIRIKGGMVVEVQSTNPDIPVIIIDEDAFDLPAYLLDEIYPQMDDDDKKHWCLQDADEIAYDLARDGIGADADEIYEIIAEFIAQDAEEQL